MTQTFSNFVLNITQSERFSNNTWIMTYCWNLATDINAGIHLLFDPNMSSIIHLAGHRILFFAVAFMRLVFLSSNRFVSRHVWPLRCFFPFKLFQHLLAHWRQTTFVQHYRPKAHHDLVAHKLLRFPNDSTVKSGLTRTFIYTKISFSMLVCC